MKTFILTTILASLLSITSLSAKKPHEVVYKNVKTTEMGYIKEYITYNEETSQIIDKISYQCDEEGNIQKRIFYKWDNRDGWRAFHKYEYAYNDEKQITCITHTKWDKKTKDWSTKEEKLNHIYNNDGRLVAVNQVQINNFSEFLIQK
ncbi:MAG: hypothetical protein ACK5KT_09875 [Dysgonomonas sp.]